MILQRGEQDFIKIVLGSGALEGSRGLYGEVPGLRSEWSLRGAAGGGAQQGQAKPSRAEPRYAEVRTTRAGTKLRSFLSKIQHRRDSGPSWCG